MREKSQQRQKRQTFLKSVLDVVENGYNCPNFNGIESIDEIIDRIINDNRSYAIANEFINTEYEEDYDLFFEAIIGAPCSFMLQVGGANWGIIFEELCEFLESVKWNSMD